jgi:UDP-3-O-[3-hydroxymyristoyl] glucosamine N-acyltransferase
MMNLGSLTLAHDSKSLASPPLPNSWLSPVTVPTTSVGTEDIAGNEPTDAGGINVAIGATVIVGAGVIVGATVIVGAGVIVGATVIVGAGLSVGIGVAVGLTVASSICVAVGTDTKVVGIL